MADMPLDINNDLAGIDLKPAAIQVFGYIPELNDEVSR
jgi:hypothetical protein